MSKLRKIMIVSGTRADYGLLKNIIKTVEASTTLDLQLVVTGSHLSQTHGYTESEIEVDGFPIAHRLPILDGVTDVASATAAALVGDHSKATQLAGYKPKVLLREGLQQTVNWFTEPANLANYKTDIYNV